MSENKPVPKKHQPKGLQILYEDRDIIVVDKVSGLLSMGTDKDKVHSAHFLLNLYVRKGNPKSKERVFIVHRLDRDTSGVMVFAKSVQSKMFLQENWTRFRKKYKAVVLGNLTKKEGVIESYMAETRTCRMYSAKENGIGKYAKTGYTVLKENDTYSLLDIELFTGRKNQIRVHFSDLGHPVVGDKVYGKKEKTDKRMALHCGLLTFIHPFSKKEMTFESRMPHYFNVLMKVREPKNETIIAIPCGTTSKVKPGYIKPSNRKKA